MIYIVCMCVYRYKGKSGSKTTLHIILVNSFSITQINSNCYASGEARVALPVLYDQRITFLLFRDYIWPLQATYELKTLWMPWMSYILSTQIGSTIYGSCMNWWMRMRCSQAMYNLYISWMVHASYMVTFRNHAWFVKIIFDRNRSSKTNVDHARLASTWMI